MMEPWHVKLLLTMTRSCMIHDALEWAWKGGSIRQSAATNQGLSHRADAATAIALAGCCWKAWEAGPLRDSVVHGHALCGHSGGVSNPCGGAGCVSVHLSSSHISLMSIIIKQTACWHLTTSVIPEDSPLATVDRSNVPGMDRCGQWTTTKLWCRSTKALRQAFTVLRLSSFKM